MDQRYVTSTFSKILFGIFLVVFGGLALFLIFAIGNQKSALPLLFLIPVLIAVCLLLLKVITSKIIIEDKTITVRDLFYSRQLAFNQIKGYRPGEKVIVIEPLNPGDKKLNISGISKYERLGDFTSFLKDNFTDLNAEDLKQEEDNFLHNNSIGATEEEREANLAKAKRNALILNIACPIAGFAALFIRNNDNAVLYLTLIPPILACVLILLSNGLITFINDRRRSPYPNVVIAFMVPIITSIAITTSRYHVLEYKNYWIPFAVISVFLLMILVLADKKRYDKVPKGQIIFMLVMCAAYGYSSTIQINCTLDDSFPMKFNTQVESKYTTSGKGAHYHLTLAPWQRGQSPVSIDVSHAEYEQTAESSPIGVHIKSGLFHIPWFYVDLGD